MRLLKSPVLSECISLTLYGCYLAYHTNFCTAPRVIHLIESHGQWYTCIVPLHPFIDLFNPMGSCTSWFGPLKPKFNQTHLLFLESGQRPHLQSSEGKT